MILIKRDVTDPKEAPLLLAKAFLPNPDGTVSVQMPDGTFAYQEPNQPGVFGRSPDQVGAYQVAMVDGQLITFWTRPQDAPYSYSWVRVPN